MTEHESVSVPRESGAGDSMAKPDTPLRDLPRWLTWFVIPMFGVSVILLLFLELLLGSGPMQSGFYPQPDGTTVSWYVLLTFKEGPTEYALVLLLLPGIAAAAYAVRHRKRFPNKKLGIWMMVCVLGLLFFAGEELSWGHHIRVSLGLKKPEPVTTGVLGVNEQGETNIHNLDNFLGKMLGRNSKNVVELWCYIGAFGAALVLARREPKLTPGDAPYWFWPTTATVVCAALVFLTYRPVRLYVKLFPDMGDPYWARQSELQEFFMAATLVVYVSSIAWRLRQMPDPVEA